MDGDDYGNNAEKINRPIETVIKSTSDVWNYSTNVLIT